MMKKITHFPTIWPHTGKVILLLSVALYVIFTLFQINRWSIWFDEGFSLYLTRYDFGQIAHFTALDVHPPLYYWVLKFWTSLFGTSDVAYRSLSLTFGVVTIVLVYFLIRKLFDTKAANWVVFLLALSPMLIRYGQEARMYTMVTAIVFGATYVLIRAMESKKTRYWVIYAVLLAAGMWTHYFTALAWLAHWVWRLIVVRHDEKKSRRLKTFFSREWLLVHMGAIALFLPWIKIAVDQLTTVQVYGFWIGPVTADSVTNFLTTFLLFRQHDHTQGWFAVLFYGTVMLLGVLLYKTHKQLKSNVGYSLVLCSILVPLVLLIVMSLPPARSSYIERYILSAIVAMSLLLGLVMRYGLPVVKSVFVRRGAPLLIVGVFLCGIAYTQTIGNFNKSTNQEINTKQLAVGIRERSDAYEPIISLSPWIYFELSPYETSAHPVYYTAESAQGKFGSLAMLQEANVHKISDLESFARGKDTIWVVNQTTDTITSPVASWKKLQSFDVSGIKDGVKRYQAVQYQVR
ncbi:MAG: glycosyltransferase family 39 protein [Candidatus Saccharimonadales bacterium]